MTLSIRGASHGIAHTPTALQTAALALATVLVLCLSGPPAAADGSRKSSDVGITGRLDPTNVPVVRNDLMATFVPGGSRLEADDAHLFATGRGVVVAVLDGGFNVGHPALAGRVLPGCDVLDHDIDVNDGGNGIDDDNDGHVDLGVGHGTFVAGMVLWAAPEATILPVRIADDEGRTTDQRVVEGIVCALGRGARVVNLSLGFDASSGAVKDVLSLCRAQGVVVVVAAGNDGAKNLGRLPKERDVIAAGATDEFDVLAPFSAGASENQVVYAPGVDLVAPFGWALPETYAQWSGTSFSAAVLTGAVALYAERRPVLDTRRTADALAASTDLAFDSSGLPAKGGRINLLAIATAP